MAGLRKLIPLQQLFLAYSLILILMQKIYAIGEVQHFSAEEIVVNEQNKRPSKQTEGLLFM